MSIFYKWILPYLTSLRGDTHVVFPPSPQAGESGPTLVGTSRTDATTIAPSMMMLNDVGQATFRENLIFNIPGHINIGQPLAADATSNTTIEPNQKEDDCSMVTRPIGDINAENNAVLGHTPKADYDIYYDQLLFKGRGLPLWIPGPNQNLPAAYRRNGISIGDVGIIYRSEGFSFLFNIFLPASHDINRGRVPEEFYPLTFSDVENDIEKRNIYGRDTCLASSTLQKTSNRDSSGFVFETSDKEGAVLIMPDGAISQDLLNRGILEQYVKDNAKHWYRYVTSKRGRTVDNGDVRLVIGLDKVSSWGIATFDSTTKQQIRLEFKGINGGQTGTTYTWNCVGNGNGRAGPSDEEMSDLRSEVDMSPILRNQCVFMRTLNFSLSGEVYKETLVHQVRSGKGGSLLPAPSNFPSNGALGGQSSSADVIFNSTPFGQPVSHPSTSFHKHLLEKYPSTAIVITEDKDWISVIRESDVVSPSQEEICTRILESFDVHEYNDLLVVKKKDVQCIARVQNPLEGLVNEPHVCPAPATCIDQKTRHNHSHYLQKKGLAEGAANEGREGGDNNEIYFGLRNRAFQVARVYLKTLFGPPKLVKKNELQKNDFVILIVGAPGAGKTEFLNKASNSKSLQKGDSLSARTPGFELILCTFSNNARRIVLVDTPPYDVDQGNIDEEFGGFAKWLSKTNAKRVNAIIYLHNIKVNRVHGSYRPSEMHKTILSICGNWGGAKVALSTTFWDDVKDVKTVCQREEQLVRSWRTSHNTKSGLYQRHNNTTQTAMEIIEGVLS